MFDLATLVEYVRRIIVLNNVKSIIVQCVMKIIQRL